MENYAAHVCQSCAMPLETGGQYGTNANGSKNEDYCEYCYKGGEFTSNSTMEEMIDFCVPHMAAGNAGMTEAGAKKQLQLIFPTLKRWVGVQPTP